MSSSSVSGTTDDRLYQYARTGDFDYRIPVNNGTYELILYFSEPAATGSGQRIFDVYAENTSVIAELDIYALVGRNMPLQYPLSVTVSDSELNLSFVSRTGSARLSAIDIKRTDATLLRIDCGSSSARYDSFGQLWAKDSGYKNGSSYSRSVSVLATTDDKLYQTQRTGKDFSYALSVANGTYEVTLYLAELWYTRSSARKFSVYAEGIRSINALDIFAQAGAKTPLIYPLTVSVRDGILDLRFLASVDNAVVSAIEVQKLAP